MREAQTSAPTLSKGAKVGGAGAFDTAFADTAGPRLYIPRKKPGRITVFNLDTLEPVGETPDAAAKGVVIDSNQGTASPAVSPWYVEQQDAADD